MSLVENSEYVELSDVKGGDFGSQRTAGIRAYDQMKKSIVQELRKNLLVVKD